MISRFGLLKILSISLTLAALSACGSQPAADLAATSMNQEHDRVELGRVTFNRYRGDFVHLGGMLLNGNAERCTFVRPAEPNASTPWPPIQSFWALFDKVKESDPRVISDTYFPGDRLTTENIQVDGKPALGFKYLTSVQKRLVDIRDVKISNDADALEFALVMPAAKVLVPQNGQNRAVETGGSAVVRGSARAVHTDGACQSVISVCLEGQKCPDQQAQPSATIHVVLTDSFMPSIDHVVLK